MNHPQKRNALSEALIDEITAALESFRKQNIRAAVLRAPAGVKVWSAGHDVSELPTVVAIHSAGAIRCGFWSAPFRNFRAGHRPDRRRRLGRRL